MLPSGQQLIEPPGYAIVTFLSTAMMVAGIGLAWTGLLLAAAGLVLALIEGKELMRLNPWLAPDDEGRSPVFAGDAKRISWVSFATTLIGAAVALAAAQTTDEPLSVLPPAAIAGVTSLVLNAQLRRVLQAPRRD